MMSPHAIREAAEKAGRHARRNGYKPLVITQAMKEEGLHAWKVGRRPTWNIPFIGDYEPEGYTLTREFFVDTSGFGTVGEAADTTEQFLEAIMPGRAYAMTEVGQFQAYIQEYMAPGDQAH